MKATETLSQSQRALGKLAFALCAATSLLALPEPTLADDCCIIRNLGTGKCLDVRKQDDYNANGARVQQYHCTFVDEQLWKTVDAELHTARIVGVELPPSTPDINLHYYHLVSKRSGKCITVDTVAPTNNGAQVIQNACMLEAHQAWHFEPVSPPPFQGAETYYLVNLFSGKCLDLDDDLSADGAKIQLWDCNFQAPAQQWFFQVVGGIVPQPRGQRSGKGR